jgi:predicted alpha/beta-fold hydrolase
MLIFKTLFKKIFSLISTTPKVYTSNEECQKLLQQCPSLNAAKIFMWSNHIQIILYIIKDFFQKIISAIFGKIIWQSEKCILEDGEEVTVDWAFPILNCYKCYYKYYCEDKTPILMIHPGALGHRKTLMGQWIKKAHSRGWIVCVYNRRGHGKLLTVPKWHFFGSAGDVEYITTNCILKTRPNAILLMLGISAGSGLTIRCFEEKNNQFVAGIGISPGIGIRKSMGRAEYPYNKFIVSGMIGELKKNANLLKNIIGYKECINAKNPQEFTDNCWAIAGYSSQDEYYNNECGMDVFTNIQNPLLLINAEDDPIAVKQNILDWKYLSNDKNHKGIFVTTEAGSHCAFLDKNMNSWSEDLVFEFFDAAVKESKRK